MGILTVANMASHLQNASRARLGLTSVPHTKYNLSVALALHRAGIGTFEPEPLTTANQARQRLWVGLKYSDNEPVLRTMSAISRPKRYISADLRALQRLSRGFDASNQKGLNLGECMFVATDLGTLEIREALERKVGGLLLCRAGP
ncbi:hypothetical protein CIB48_g6032 [Xylaria polymorpha]|nr:hypothetical protein CIB48_g6032 [Xylaria polymorpha]